MLVIGTVDRERRPSQSPLTANFGLWQKEAIDVHLFEENWIHTKEKFGMRDALPLRIYYDLNEVRSAWNATTAELGQWLCEGILRAHIWLPLSSFYEIERQTRGEQIIQTRFLCHREGYFQLLDYDCRKLLHDGRVFVREFADTRPGRVFALPECVPSKAVELDQLVILQEEKQRFEKAFDLGQLRDLEGLPEMRTQSHANSDFNPVSISGKFRKVRFSGKAYSFGIIQASVLFILYQAAEEGTPWVSGKQVLAKAGSLSFSISNLFKRKSGWRNLITSDGLGNYRLDPDFFIELEGRTGFG